jgi:hypothetical protein
MFDSIEQLLAADPSFQIPGGRSDAPAILPGEQRLMDYMKRQNPGSASPSLPGAPALPPVREAFGLPVDPNVFLEGYLQSNRLA